MILFAVFTLGSYFFIQNYVTHEYDFLTPIDKAFPFMPEFILRMSEMSMELFNMAIFDYSLDEIEPVKSISSDDSSSNHPPLLLIHAEDDETVRYHHVSIQLINITHTHTHITAGTLGSR